MDRCFLCNEVFEIGPAKDEGRFVSRYQVQVCNNCYRANWDGWAPQFEEKLIVHLQERGLSIPARNDLGWLPRD